MSEVYRIGVAIMLTDALGPALSRISEQLLGVHKTAKEIEGTFNRWRQALIGAGAIMVGSGILHGLGKVAEHGKEILDQQDKLTRAGRTQAEVAELTADAYERITKAVPTATAADVLRIANELTLVKGNFKEAAEAASQSLKLEALVGNSTGRKSEGEGYNVWRALELKNVTMDKEKTDRLMGGITDSIIASGGKLTGAEWYNVAKQGGVAWTNMSEQFLARGLPTIMQELGGMRTGTAAMTAYQFLAGSATMSKQQVRVLDSLDMLNMDKVHKDHGRWNLDPGALKGSEKGMHDPYEWVQQVLKPHLEAAGRTTIESQRELMGKMFPNRNANRFFDILLDPASTARIEKDAALYKQAKPLDAAYGDFTTNNPKGVEAAFHAQYESMMGAIGAPLMQAAMPVMRAVTDLFNKIGEFASQHGTAIKVIGSVIAGLAVGLTALGVALVGGAIVGAIGVGGWLIAGLVALGTALGTLYAVFHGGKGTPDALAPPAQKATADAAVTPGLSGIVTGLSDFAAKMRPAWEAVKGQLSEAWQAQTQFWSRIGEAAKHGVTVLAQVASDIGKEIASWPGKLAGVIAQMGAGIVSGIGSALSGAWNSIKSHMPGGGGAPAAAAPGKQGYNAVPPANGGSKHASNGDIYMDGRKVGEVVSRHQATAMNGPLQGSAYYDGSATFVPADYAFARG